MGAHNENMWLEQYYFSEIVSREWCWNWGGGAKGQNYCCYTLTRLSKLFKSSMRRKTTNIVLICSIWAHKFHHFSIWKSICDFYANVQIEDRTKEEKRIQGLSFSDIIWMLHVRQGKITNFCCMQQKTKLVQLGTQFFSFRFITCLMQNNKA